MKKRLFTAFRVEPNNEIAELLDFLKGFSSTKVVEKRNLHVNLKFLGNVKENKLKDALSALKEAKDFGKTKAVLKGTGAFPSREYIKVLWIGVHSEGIKELASLLEDSFTERGFKERNRKYVPHVTLARVKKKPSEKIKEIFEEKFDRHYKDIKVKNVELIESELTPEGPLYKTIGKVEI